MHIARARTTLDYSGTRLMLGNFGFAFEFYIRGHSYEFRLEIRVRSKCLFCLGSHSHSELAIWRGIHLLMRRDSSVRDLPPTKRKPNFYSLSHNLVGTSCSRRTLLAHKIMAKTWTVAMHIKLNKYESPALTLYRFTNELVSVHRSRPHIIVL